jgi:hypothetical protein
MWDRMIKGTYHLAQPVIAHRALWAPTNTGSLGSLTSTHASHFYYKLRDFVRRQKVCKRVEAVNNRVSHMASIALSHPHTRLVFRSST